MPKNPNAPATGATTRKTTARHVSLRSAIDADAVPREPTGRLALQFRGWRRNETRRPRARRPQKKSPGRGAGAFGVGDRRSEAEAQGPDDLVRVEIAVARREAGYDAAFRLAAMEIAVADVERERRAEIERAAGHGLPGERVRGAAGDAVHGAARDVDGRAVDLGQPGARARRRLPLFPWRQGGRRRRNRLPDAHRRFRHARDRRVPALRLLNADPRPKSPGPAAGAFLLRSAGARPPGFIPAPAPELQREPACWLSGNGVRVDRRPEGNMPYWALVFSSSRWLPARSDSSASPARRPISPRFCSSSSS